MLFDFYVFFCGFEKGVSMIEFRMQWALKCQKLEGYTIQRQLSHIFMIMIPVYASDTYHLYGLPPFRMLLF